MREIFSSVRGLSLPNVRVRPLHDLSAREREWVVKTTKSLLKNAVLPEAVTANLFLHFNDVPIRQAYFKIRGRSYFADFFFPRHLAVVEIDGSSHRRRKEKDKQRDADFRSVGIRTIRIPNKAVMEGRLLAVLYGKLC